MTAHSRCDRHGSLTAAGVRGSKALGEVGVGLCHSCWDSIVVATGGKESAGRLVIHWWFQDHLDRSLWICNMIYYVLIYHIYMICIYIYIYHSFKSQRKSCSIQFLIPSFSMGDMKSMEFMGLIVFQEAPDLENPPKPPLPVEVCVVSMGVSGFDTDSHVFF